MLTAAFKSERGTLRWPSLMAAMKLALGARGSRAASPAKSLRTIEIVPKQPDR
jgi:hypothetical protein